MIDFLNFLANLLLSSLENTDGVFRNIANGHIPQ